MRNTGGKNLQDRVYKELFKKKREKEKETDEGEAIIK